MVLLHTLMFVEHAGMLCAILFDGRIVKTLGRNICDQVEIFLKTIIDKKTMSLCLCLAETIIVDVRL